MIYLLLSILTQASFNSSFATDRDLTGYRRPLFSVLKQVSRELPPDQVVSQSAQGPQQIRTFLRRKTQLQALQLPWKNISHCDPQTLQVKIAAPLEVPGKFVVTHPSGTYFATAFVPCNGTTDLIYDAPSAAGQPIAIWSIAFTAMVKLQQTVGLDFLQKQIALKWPADGDYYSFYTVYLTRGDFWDVVGHELGHAIYHQAQLGQSTGGEHYIDRCYNETMALSEGWASFFSAWISLDPRDPDAKFEFMVPRRAPIQIENVPSDVCKGPTNEWRVTSFFWDLFDLNNDGEDVAFTFASLWQPLMGRRPVGTSAVKSLYLRAGMPQNAMEQVWLKNLEL